MIDFEAIRAAVQTHLATEFATAEVVAGERDGVWRGEKDLVAVWWPDFNVFARDTSIGTPELLFRYFPRRSKAPTSTTPVDPAPLEQAAAAILTALPRSTEVGGFFVANTSLRLTRLTPNYDPDLWRIQGALTVIAMRGSA